MEFKTVVEDIRRINQKEPKKLEHKILKLNEEYGEMNAEVIKLLGYTYKSYDKQDLIDELADTLQCLISVIVDIEEKADFTMEDVLAAVSKKNQKWESRIKEYRQ